MHIKTSRKTGPRTIVSKTLAEECAAKELTRRQMVQAVMLGTVGTWLGASGLVGCGTKTVVNGSSSSGEPGADAGGSATETKHLVGMGYDPSDRNVALEAALAETIGLGMIKAGESVYLRVNANSGDLYPYSTSPDTILAIGGMLRDIGVTDIRVGDRSFWGDTNTAGNLTKNGIAGAAKKIGTSAIAYDDNVDWVTLPAGSTPNWVDTVRLPEPVMTADHQIILSCVKTHFISEFTMALKIGLGLVHADDRKRDGNLKTHDTRVLYKQIAQINQAFTPSLVVMDGYSAIISGGPTKNDRPAGAPSSFTGGVAGKPKVFIVSTDRIAADVAGIAVLQTLSPEYEAIHDTKPFSNPQIKAAVAADLGISDASAFDLSGPTVPELETYLAKVTG
ncbi:MAG: DUF362 domain-containing protein [Labilithrix sp.]|nr:DUF362 domain-containing protein [Labilithrix sp.]